LTQEANNDLATFRSLSGCLDMIASMQHKAKDLSDMQHEDAKKEKVNVFLIILSGCYIL